MCGIAGIYDFQSGQSIDQECLQAMIQQLHHRGPDGTGFKLFKNVGLAHARLSIIDLTTGDQPIHNEDQSVWTVFNGEISNSRAGDPARLVADASLARKELNWKPAFSSLETIIKHAWLWEEKLAELMN